MKALFLFVIIFSVMNSGCSTFSSDKKEAASPPAPVDESGRPYARFSDSPSLPVTSNRQYRRMTRQRMEEEADIHAQAGSMWVMEGQGAYLFAQNKTRREGDLLNVRIEGAAQKQIETKVAVIKKLLKQLEEEERKAQEGDQAPAPPLADNQSNKAPGSPARTPASATDKKPDEKEEPLNIEFVPTRIVERQADGNYRIKGQQPFMIGKREYKVIVTGIIRAEDFNDEGLGSNKILDPQFDVVSLRKKEQ